MADDPRRHRCYSCYDPEGTLQRVVRAQGSADERATDYAADGLGRARSEIQYPSWPATTPALVAATTYDLDGNPQALTDPLGQVTTRGYDALDRLTGLTYTNPATGTATMADVTYGYDAHGNRTSLGDGTGTTTYAYDEADRPTSIAQPQPGGTTTVGSRYDRDGNRTKVIYPDTTAVTYTYDKADRPAALADGASPARTTSYTYFSCQWRV